VEEPQLAEHHRGGEQSRRDQTERRRDDWNEREQPDEVLR
jgi:hypothetical protein